jgi:hypothetical protein
MENLIEVLKKFLPLIHVPPIIQNKIEILNLTALKTQIPINYLTLRKKKKKKKKTGASTFICTWSPHSPPYKFIKKPFKPS